MLNNKPNFITQGPFVKSFNIALIKPTFTAAAYHNAFYKFYFRYVSIPHARKNVTTDLNLLSSRVTNQTTGLTSSGFAIYYLSTHLRLMFPKHKITILTDADAANNNSLFFLNGTNKFDMLILGHQEYVSQQEYDNLKRFVSNGGTLIALIGDSYPFRFSL